MRTTVVTLAVLASLVATPAFAGLVDERAADANTEVNLAAPTPRELETGRFNSLAVSAEAEGGLPADLESLTFAPSPDRGVDERGR
jgi:hypothetical protein